MKVIFGICLSLSVWLWSTFVGPGLTCSYIGCKVDYTENKFSTAGIKNFLFLALGLELFGEKSFAVDGRFYQHSAINKFDLYEPINQAKLDQINEDFLALLNIIGDRSFTVIVVPDKYLFRCGGETSYIGPICDVLLQNLTAIYELIDSFSLENDSLEVVDPFGLLLSQKGLDQIYWIGDSHWNSLGAHQFLSQSRFLKSTNLSPLEYKNLDQKNDLARQFDITRNQLNVIYGKARGIQALNMEIIDQKRSSSGLLVYRRFVVANDLGVTCAIASDSFIFDALPSLSLLCSEIIWSRVNSFKEAGEFFQDTSNVDNYIFIRAQKGFNFYRVQEK